MKEIDIKLKKILPSVQKNVPLKKYTAFKIGGRAKYFFVAETKEDLIKAIKVAKELDLPFFILAGGSNVLISDKGFNGLVIKIQNREYKIQDTKITAGAGTTLAELTMILAKAGLSGLEWAAGIPGTVGGAIHGNAGWPSNKRNISSIIEWVEVLETKPKLKIKNYKLKDCEFDYRDSVFKHKPEVIILSVCLKLKKGNGGKIKKEILEILKKRKEKIPSGFSAGSVFKNPLGFSAGELGEEDKSSSSRLAAARLIEECGLKGKKIGNAKISEKHANFIVNLGNAKAKDVKKLIKIIKNKVKNKFGIVLKEEIQFLGF